MNSASQNGENSLSSEIFYIDLRIEKFECLKVFLCIHKGIMERSASV